MAGTPQLSTLLQSMREEYPQNEYSDKRKNLTFPPSAYYHLTCLPEDILSSTRRKVFNVPFDKFYWPRICLYNSTVFHAYWLMVGDAFDVLASLFKSCRLPYKWSSSESLLEEATRIGREFCDEQVLERTQTVFQQNGNEFPNHNFHKFAPELIRRADRVCIKGYGLEEHESTLIEQIQKVRLFQTWDL